MLSLSFVEGGTKTSDFNSLALCMSHTHIYVAYRKRGKVCWAKVLRFSWFSSIPQKFSVNLYLYLYKLRIMALFKCFKRKVP